MNTSSTADPARGVQVNAAKLRVPPIKKLKSGRKKREHFIVNAKRFAQVLLSFEDEHGYPPLIKDMAEQLGYSIDKPVGVSRTIKEMVKRGWLFHERGHHGDFAVTEEGIRVLFGGQMPTPATRPAGDPPAPEPVVAPSAPTKHRSMDYPVPPPRPEPRFEVRRAPVWQDTAPRPVVQVYEPKQSPEQEPGPEPMYAGHTGKPDLSKVDSIDLLFELQDRGFRVTR
jgi:hypothetical protein